MSNNSVNKPELTDEELRELKEVAQGEIKKKRNAVGKTVGYIAGSIALFAVAAKVVPMALDTLGAKLYKHNVKNSLEDDDDWELVIEKKTGNEED